MSFKTVRRDIVLYADGNITEVTRDHTVVFSYKPEIQKGGGAFSCQRLPNGNVVTGCYAAYTREGKGTGMLEITRDKKPVWRYVSPNVRDTSMMGVHKLSGGAEIPLR